MSAPVIAIVTGSRDWTDVRAIEAPMLSLPTGSILFHGDCPTGADAIADSIARTIGMEVRRFPADWRRHGRRAGPLRNRGMRDAALRASSVESMPVVCLAFPLPQSKGTLDMMALCEAEGWDVRNFGSVTP